MMLVRGESNVYDVGECHGTTVRWASCSKGSHLLSTTVGSTAGYPACIISVPDSRNTFIMLVDVKGRSLPPQLGRGSNHITTPLMQQAVNPRSPELLHNVIGWAGVAVQGARSSLVLEDDMEADHARRGVLHQIRKVLCFVESFNFFCPEYTKCVLEL